MKRFTKDMFDKITSGNIECCNEIISNLGNCLKNQCGCEKCPFNTKNFIIEGMSFEGCEYVLSYLLDKDISNITDFEFLNSARKFILEFENEIEDDTSLINKLKDDFKVLGHNQQIDFYKWSREFLEIKSKNKNLEKFYTKNTIGYFGIIQSKYNDTPSLAIVTKSDWDNEHKASSGFYEYNGSDTSDEAWEKAEENDDRWRELLNSIDGIGYERMECEFEFDIIKIDQIKTQLEMCGVKYNAEYENYMKQFLI